MKTTLNPPHIEYTYPKDRLHVVFIMIYKLHTSTTIKLKVTINVMCHHVDQGNIHILG